MKSSIADPNIPLGEIRQARARRNQFIEDTRRYHAAALDPRTRKAPWKVREENGPLPPAWEFERDNEGKILVARQLRAVPNTMDTEPKFHSRRYICQIDGDPCCIGGEHVTHGCKVECYAEAAFAIHGVRGRIIEEFPGA